MAPFKQEGPQTTRPSFIAITPFFLPPHLQSSACGRGSWRRLGVNNQRYGAGKPVTLVNPNVLCRRLLRPDLSCGSSLHLCCACLEDVNRGEVSVPPREL
jgi:hypothetical protein